MSYHDYSLSATQAKKEYFLNTNDLVGVPYSAPRGWGCGRSKYYKPSDLEVVAGNKHGLDGLVEKRAKRARREENQRRKEQEAKAAAAALLGGGGAAAPGNHVVDLTGEEENQARLANVPIAGQGASAAGAPSVSASELATLRKEIRRGFKPFTSWDYLRSKNQPNGTNATVRLPRVEQREFCALIGRSSDPELRSLVKKGAWYSCNVSYNTVFGQNAPLMIGSGGRYNCNSDLGVDPGCHMCVKYSPSNMTLSVTAFVCHTEMFEYNEEY